MGWGYHGGYWKPYVSVAERQRKAQREMEKLRKKGHPVSPVVVQGQAIARTFWGKAWCENLERYSDYSNRLPRGRTYVRNGSVVDLQVSPGKVVARVSGSELYAVKVKVSPLRPAKWKALCADCTGAIDSLVELLQGRFSKGVMERVCEKGTGLFPAPGEIQFDCSCPDWASMCKHVAAVLYGIGARLDEKPELLFRLRKVDESELIARAGEDLPLAKTQPASDRVLQNDEVAALFGLEMEAAPTPGDGEPAPAPRSAARRRLRPVAAAVATGAQGWKAAAPSPGKGGGRRASTAVRNGLAAFHQGQTVLYRQGRGTFEAIIVGLDEVKNTLVLERCCDGKKVTRPVGKVTVTAA